MPDDRAYETLGTWLRQRRKALDLTQAALAHCVGCAEVTIRKLEAVVARPSRQIAQRLAVCLELPPSELELFLQVARGERPVERLPPAHPADNARAPASVEVPVTRLPLDRVPPSAPLPAGSRMPLRRNPLFVGREEDLRQLACALTMSGTAAIGQVEIAAATGLGGIGKTQLACEFVHRYGQFFAGGVFWLSFADPAAVPAEVAVCGGSEGMQLSPTFDTLPLDVQVQRVRTAWTQPLPRLLVFDNCEDEALLHQWQPPHGGCRVLVTSRRHHWDPALGVQAVALDVLPRLESLRLLRQFRPDLPADDADLAAIAALLGDLPLALHLAGSFLAKYRHALTPAQYLARLHMPTILDDRSLQAVSVSPTTHVYHVARTFEQSYERLDPADPIDALALMLLAHAACFAPGEPLPRWLLLETLGLSDEDVERALLVEDALMRLIDLGLLNTDAGGTLRMHRLVVAFAQVVLGAGVAQVVVEASMLRVVDDLNERRNPQVVLAVQPHLRFLTDLVQQRADARSAALYHALGVHVWQLGGYVEAKAYLDGAVGIRKRVLGMNHPDTAKSLNTLGSVLGEQGRYVEAQEYLEQALTIQQQVLGTEHPDTATSLNNLGNVFYLRGQYADAQHSYAQALAIRQRLFGADHPDTARSLSNLGNVLYDQEQYAEAQGFYEQVVAIQERSLGKHHPDIAGSLHCLGGVLQAQSQYAAAQDYHAQALVIRERVLGMDHPLTAWSLQMLGEVFHAQSQYTVAQDYHAQAFAIRTQVLGMDHPDTARSLRALGEVQHAQGNVTQARHYLEQALAIFRERLGPQHPDTVRGDQILAALDSDRTAIEGGSDG